MSQVVSNQSVNGSCGSSQRRRLMTVSLWIFQGLLALLFLFAGSMKLVLPIEVLTEQTPLPGLFLRFIGIAEVLGAIGLILPCLLRILPGLTPVAACGLLIIMLGATAVTVLSGGAAASLIPLVVGLLCAFVAYSRRESLLALILSAKLFLRGSSTT
ncbi:MAG: DoxX family protein [Ktedonobacteraceae bacterium]|nr:DoxX family protein [Ktedonobacteraceae bacterium]